MLKNLFVSAVDIRIIYAYNVDERSILKLLIKDGWCCDYQRGSHKYFRHPTKVCKITVADHGHKAIPKKTLNSILEQAELQIPMK